METYNNNIEELERLRSATDGKKEQIAKLYMDMARKSLINSSTRLYFHSNSYCVKKIPPNESERSKNRRLKKEKQFIKHVSIDSLLEGMEYVNDRIKRQIKTKKKIADAACSLQLKENNCKDCNYTSPIDAEFCVECGKKFNNVYVYTSLQDKLEACNQHRDSVVKLLQDRDDQVNNINNKHNEITNRYNEVSKKYNKYYLLSRENKTIISGLEWKIEDKLEIIKKLENDNEGLLNKCDDLDKKYNTLLLKEHDSKDNIYYKAYKELCRNLRLDVCKRQYTCSNCKHYNESCSTGILYDQINGCGLWEGWEPSVKFLSGLILKEDN